MHAVFLDQQTFNQHIDLCHIEQQVTQLTCYSTTQPEDVIARCQNAEIIISNKVVLNEVILKQLPSAKLICVTATGYNNIDIAAANKQGVTVCNVTGYSNESVSQYVFAQLLEYFSNIAHHNQNTADGLWQKSPVFCHLGNNMHEIAGKKLGIIGYGNLGKTISTIAKAFSMEVLIAERKNSETIRPGRSSFDEVIQNADIITLHCPQTPETVKMIDANFLKSMKSSAVLINTARGPVVDNTALVNALKTQEIAYAILDVIDIEPPSGDHPLLSAKLDNLKITAHIAWASVEAQQRLISLIGKNIQAFKSGAAINVIA